MNKSKSYLESVSNFSYNTYRLFYKTIFGFCLTVGFMFMAVLAANLGFNIPFIYAPLAFWGVSVAKNLILELSLADRFSLGNSFLIVKIFQVAFEVVKNIVTKPLEILFSSRILADTIFYSVTFALSGFSLFLNLPLASAIIASDLINNLYNFDKEPLFSSQTTEITKSEPKMEQLKVNEQIFNIDVSKDIQISQQEIKKQTQTFFSKLFSNPTDTKAEKIVQAKESSSETNIEK